MLSVYWELKKVTIVFHLDYSNILVVTLGKLSLLVTIY